MTREPKWTRRELAELKYLFETGIPTPVIAETLGRTISAIKTRAQLCGYRRPRRFGRKEIDELRTYAVKQGLDEAVLPTNPTALRILICLARAGIASTTALDKACAVSSSGRNKAIQLLRSTGLVYVDEFRNPAEVVLTRKAFSRRPEPVLATPEQVKIGALPTLARLLTQIDVWLPACCKNQASIEGYKALLVRQLENANSGDISPAEFYSIFYRPDRT